MRWARRLIPLEVVALVLGFAILPSSPAFAQSPQYPGIGAEEVFAGGEWEEYLRFLQSLGRAKPYPWSVRAFSPSDIHRILPLDTLHPWKDRGVLAGDTAAGLQLHWIAPRAQLIHNSAFPYGSNDGAVWAGKGLTTVLQGGMAVRYGPLSLVLAPIVFRAENESFPLAGDTRPGKTKYADPMGVGIDLPQRFGDEAYTRIDPGQSTLRIDFPAVTVGISTANQHWGPATTHPLLLGNNAPGFPHVFVGTGRPLDIGIGRVHGRVLLGQLAQSDYFPAPDSVRRRSMSGMVAVFVPRGLPNLELGGARIFQARWSNAGIRGQLGQIFGPFFKVSGADPNDQAGGDTDQRASLFGRWVAPRSGFEFYGEYAREDHNWDLRDFLLEPDHSAGYVIGFRKAWPISESRLLTLRGEVLNTQPSHLQRVRHQGIFYAGSTFPQGHAHRGQILGSAAGFGGSGRVLASDYYSPIGRWTITWARAYAHGPGVGLPPLVPDVLHSVGINALFFRGRWDLNAGLDGVYRRDPYRGVNEVNVNSVFQVRIGL
jgi:hypothetical protein